ncbi:thermonuclease family protein [Chloroflexota bacterium]
MRYVGIDTPEIRPRVEAFGLEAWQANCELIAGEEVRLEQDITERDKYGRLLHYVYVDDILVNAGLARLGFAEAKAYPPDIRYQDLLESMEAEARAAGRGMWAESKAPL